MKLTELYLDELDRESKLTRKALEREHALGQLIERLCAAEGFTPRAALRSAQIAGVAALAAAGLGPAVVPANIVTPAGITASATRRIRARTCRCGTRPPGVNQ